MNNIKKYDYLIVGAGLYGATFAHLARSAGKKCLVIDKREQVGGNLYCESVEGINVHKYGAHIFHTSNKEVWDFVNSIVEFNRYTNSPLANYRDKLFNLPFNMNTFYQIWGVVTPEQARAKIQEQSQKAREKMLLEGVDEPRNLEEQALLLVGEDIYNTLIKDYTQKQWGRKCSELPAFIIKRLPLRFVYDNNYFNDTYQGIPIGGYNVLIEGLLEGVETRTGVDFFEKRAQWEQIAETIVFTGKLDEYFDYCLGELEYRSVRFEQEILETANYQGNAVVNYTDSETPYTRVIEHKHFESFGEGVNKNPRTVISREYSFEWNSSVEPYYPINDERNNALAQRYRELAESQKNVIFGGRLAEYRYYDMAPIVEKVLNLGIWES